MKRMTVRLPDELDARLRHEAERREVTVSELLRAAIESHLAAPETTGRRRLRAAEASASGRNDVAERLDEFLAEEGCPLR